MNKKKISALLIATLVAINSVASLTVVNVFAEGNTIEERAALITDDVEEVFTKQNDDQKGLELVGQTDCEGGACPIK